MLPHAREISDMDGLGDCEVDGVCVDVDVTLDVAVLDGV